MISRFLDLALARFRRVTADMRQLFSVATERLSIWIQPLLFKVRSSWQRMRFFLEDKGIHLPVLSILSTIPHIPELPHPATLDWSTFVPQPARLTIQGKMTATIVAILVVGLVVGLLPTPTNIALGAYTSSTTDADGNTHLGSNSVNDTFLYDRSTDSSPETQQQLGVDPNWANGVSRRSYALSYGPAGANSTSGYMQSGSSFPDITNKFTIEAWVKIPAYDAYGDTIASSAKDNTSWIDLWIDGNGAVQFDLYASAVLENTSTANATVPLNTWTHVTGAYDGSKTYIFVDGVLKGTSSGVTKTAYAGAGNSYLKVGQLATLNGYKFNGIIDEVRVSNMARYIGTSVGTSYFSAPRRYVEDANTVGLWHFDEGVDTIAYDSSVYANNLTMQNGTSAPKWVTGANAIMDGYDGSKGPQATSGAGNITLADRSSDSSDNAYELKATGSNALDFDGTDNYVFAADNDTLDLGTSNFTLEAWVKLDAAPSSAYRCIITKNSATYPNYQLCLNSSNVFQGGYEVTSGAGNNSLVAGTTTPTTGQWYHVAVTADRSGSTKLWVNGVLEGTTAASSNSGTISNTAQLWVGGATTSGLYWNGPIDEVRISDTVRYTDSFTPGRRFATDANTRGLWHFDEGQLFTTTVDSSGNSRDFTIGSASGGDTNDPTWAEGLYASTVANTSSQNWALPGYSYRKQVSVAANAAMDAGYGIETTESRATALNNKQTRSDGKDWRVMYQPSDTYRSLSFDNGDTVTVPDSSSLNLGTSDFTIEAWVKGSAMADSDIIVGKSNGGSASSSYGFLLGTFDSLKPTLYFASSATFTKIQSATTLANGQWYHVAVVVDRDNSSNTKMYVNGTENSTSVTSLSSNTAAITNTVSLVLGSESDGGFNWEGKIDEVRISNSLRYTGNFTPSRSPFTSDSNTLGLWHLDEASGQYIIDASSNQNNGYLGATTSSSTDDPTWQTGTTADGAVAVAQEVPRFIPHGNAAVFSGSNYVSLSTVPGSTVATTEAWIKPDGTDYSNPQAVVAAARLQGNAGSAQFALVAKDSTMCPDGSWGTRIGRGATDLSLSQVVCAGSGVANDPEVYSATNFPSTSWTHLAVAYDGATVRMFRNGKLVKTVTQTVIAGASGEELALGKFGGYAGGFYKGMIDEVRISTTVRYTKSFTPQTTPFAKDADTLVLLHLDETDNTTVTDEAGTVGGNFNVSLASNRAINGGKVDSAKQTQFKLVAPIANGATAKDYYLYYGNPNESSSAQSYSAYALQLDGLNDYVNITSDNGANTSLNPSGGFTIAAWYKAGASQAAPIFMKRSESNGSFNGMWGIGQGAGCSTLTASYQVCFIANYSPGSNQARAYYTHNGVLSDLNWHYIVASYNSDGTVAIYIDGGSAQALDTDQSFGGVPNLTSNSGPLRIGNSFVTGTSKYANGSVDDVRYYKRTLGATEASLLYSNAPAVSNSNLVGWWKMDDATVAGTTVTDSSGNGYNGTLTNANFTSSSNWIVNANVKSTTAPTVSTVSTAEQESPIFFEYRTASTSAWTSDRSKVFQLTTGEQQLGSTGVYLSFNPQGVYSKEDHYTIASWAIENSPSGGIRGVRNNFPQKANIIASGAANATGYVDIIDATTNKLWMRFTTATSNLLPVASHASSPVALSVTALNGRLYISNYTGGMIEVQFDLDDAHRYAPSGATYSGNGSYSGNIAQRNSASGYQTAGGSTMYTSATVVYKVCAAVVGTKQYAAAATEGGVSVVQNITSFEPNTRSGTILNYSYTTNTQYTSCALTSGGELYAATGTLVASGSRRLNRWDNVQSDSSSQTTSADATYDTATAPVLRNTTINNISVTEGTSTADTSGSSNTIAIAHTTGVDVVQEHTTKTSGTVRYYTKSGSTGTSNWSNRQFGGALSFDGADDYVVMNSTAGATPFNFSASDYTAEAWINVPSDITSGATIVSQFGSAGAGNAAWRFAVVNSGGLYLYAAHHDGTTTGSVQSTSSFSADTWHHVAANYVNSTKTLTFYIDGVAAGSGTLSNVVPQNSTNYNVYVGRDQVGSLYFKGQMDEVRISKASRYSAAFTPSTAPFDGGVANTSLSLHLDEIAGTSVADSSSNGYTGTLTNGPQLIVPAIAGSSDIATAVGLSNPTSGGSALSFDGLRADTTHGDYIAGQSSGTNFPTGSSARTISVWIKASSNGANASSDKSIFHYGTDGFGAAAINFHLYIKSSTGYVGFGNGFGYGIVSGTTNVDDGNWHYVVGTFDGGTGNAKVYVDGSLQTTGTFSTTPNTGTGSNWKIGDFMTANTGGTYSGSIDDVRIYNRALKSGEINTLYNNKASSSSITSGLVGHWKMNIGNWKSISSTMRLTMEDASGNGNYGRLMNGTGDGSTTTASDGVNNGPTFVSGSPIKDGRVLWVGTNDTTDDHGALTAISLDTDRQIRSLTESGSGLPDNDISSLSLGNGGLALVGTEDAGAWSPGGAGFVIDDTASSAATTQQTVRVKSGGTVRVKSGGTVRVKPN